jgi:hypothetical protein
MIFIFNLICPSATAVPLPVDADEYLALRDTTGALRRMRTSAGFNITAPGAF